MTHQFKEELARMTALAERFASEGQMSLNKLIAAAVYSQIRRSGWKYRPLVSKDRMGIELENTVQALKNSGLSEALMTAIETCSAYLKSGNNILYEHAPNVFVCRTCQRGTLSCRAIEEFDSTNTNSDSKYTTGNQENYHDD